MKKQERCENREPVVDERRESLPLWKRSVIVSDMETNSENGGTLADVEAAGVAGRRAAQPWWLLALDILLVAGLWAMTFGGDQSWSHILLAFAAFAVPVLLLWWITKRRGRAATFVPRSRAANVFWVGFIGAMVGAIVVARNLEPGRALTVVAVFLVVMVVYGGCRVAAERIAVRPSS